MQQNILRDASVTKIFLIYVENGSRKKMEVSLRFMDNKQCYFSTSTINLFQKPKKKLDAELKVYTIDGVYTTKVKLLDSNVSLKEIMFEVSVPKTWDYVQLRSSTRKNIELPLTIKFNDGFEIQAQSYDLSLGGISFFSKEEINSIYKKISGILSFELPKNTIINFPDGKMTTEAKFVREVRDMEDHFDEKLYIFKFMSVSLEDKEVLKSFLIRLN